MSKSTHSNPQPNNNSMAKELLDIADRVVRNLEEDEKTSAYLTSSEVLACFQQASTTCDEIQGIRYNPKQEQQCVANLFKQVITVMKEEKKFMKRILKPP